MPPVRGCLVLMCGFPSSGKSAAAARLAERVRALGGDVVIVDEPSLHLARNAAYANAHAEKNTRGLLKSTVDRQLYKDGPVVIVDSMNGIKGYRYELWCIARQAGTRFCVVHCDVSAEEARRWNVARRGGDAAADVAADVAATGMDEEERTTTTTTTTTTGDRVLEGNDEQWGGYDEAIFDDLVFRFERPDSKNRWDSPLYTLRPPLTPPEAGSEGYVDASREEILDVAAATIVGKRENDVRGGAGNRALKPNAATQPSTLLSDTNLRVDIDAGAQEVIDAVIRATSDGGGGGGAISFGDELPQLRCRQPLSLQVLRRLKRTFLKAVAGSLARTQTTRVQIKRLFIEYVQRNAELDSAY